MRDYYAECVLGVPAPPDDHEPYDTWEHGRAPWSAARAELHIEDVRIAHERAETAKARAKKEAEAKRREHLLPPRADVAHPFGAPRDARRVANARAIPPTRQETFNRWVWEEAEDLGTSRSSTDPRLIEIRRVDSRVLSDDEVVESPPPSSSALFSSFAAALFQSYAPGPGFWFWP